MNRQAILYAVVSAALFGVSTPAAKTLLGTIHPAMLAGLLYVGAGFGIAVLRRASRLRLKGELREAALSRAELPCLAGAIIAGGVVGPFLLLIGLRLTAASTASLLLTLEGAATVLMAWFLFHENFDRRIAAGMACIVAGTFVLSWSGSPTISGISGPLAIAGACLAWALDNNLTRKVSLADPLQIVELKGLIAGPVNIGLAFMIGASIPDIPTSTVAALVGFLGYGVSLTLFVLALRDLGTARTSAYFSTAPFIGAVASVLALGEPVTLQLLLAGALMACGVWLHLTEHHEHDHVHDSMAHAHPHLHDEHHRHQHVPDDPPGEPHTHRHQHGRLKHSHPHVPDTHHRHEH
jgi:drug/metabolite transporter (DMT)-like permease